MTTFRLPDLGEGLAEAEIVEWHVRVGDRVEVDQPLVSVETAKAVVEIPAPYAGTVSALHGAPGEILATGAALIEFEGGATVVGSMPPTSPDELIEHARPGRDPGEPRHGADSRRVRALPAARALAQRLGLDLGSLHGSGHEGQITIEDVLAAAPLQQATTPPATPAPAGHAQELAEPLRGARRTMAQSMTAARDEVALSTVFEDADIDLWLDSGAVMARLMRAIVAGCRAEPALNAWYDPRTSSRTVHPQVDLAVAVDTADGLLVPVIRDVGGKTAAQLAAELDALKSAAHARRLSPEQLRGYTIMLSNFGTVAGRYATPQVVPPAVAILGAGRTRRAAVPGAEAVAVHRVLPLSLSFDHRCVTGGEACRFLAAAIADLQSPE
ncbi:MAG: 2-oxo acid dehydrogenase subunit E2 [Gammaproteobacteria bacterium]|nr:2-oxo acid dehydrogenase subunit E2 [Gammaproteobacteria bacterium]